jgi:hypothetical protein
VSETTLKLATWYFTNKELIDRVKDDQYVQELQARGKEITKISSHVWANPDVKQLWESLRDTLGIGREDAPLFTADTNKPQGAHGANPLNAKGDQQ